MSVYAYYIDHIRSQISSYIYIYTCIAIYTYVYLYPYLFCLELFCAWCLVPARIL